jgi:hypothetical protein
MAIPEMQSVRTGSILRTRTTLAGVSQTAAITMVSMSAVVSPAVVGIYKDTAGTDPIHEVSVAFTIGT